MTNREAFATALAVLGAAFDRKLTGPAIQGYWIALQDLGELEFASATARALKECRFMPTPAELLAFAGKRDGIAAEIAFAWEAVRWAVDKHDYTTSVDFGPLVNAVVRNLGGWQRLCCLELEALNVWARKEFERVYALFADKPADALHGAPHMGAFGGPPTRIPIAGKLPPLQIAVASSPIASLVRELADAKSDPSERGATE